MRPSLTISCKILASYNKGKWCECLREVRSSESEVIKTHMHSTEALTCEEYLPISVHSFILYHVSELVLCFFFTYLNLNSAFFSLASCSTTFNFFYIFYMYQQNRSCSCNSSWSMLPECVGSASRSHNNRMVYLEHT